MPPLLLIIAPLRAAQGNQLCDRQSQTDAEDQRHFDQPGKLCAHCTRYLMEALENKVWRNVIKQLISKSGTCGEAFDLSLAIDALKPLEQCQ